jgi:thiamine biosynthesis protein ThiS
MNVIVNGQPREVPDSPTVSELLALLELPRRGIAVEVNLEIVPHAELASRKLAEGDRLEVVSLVGGG